MSPRSEAVLSGQPEGRRILALWLRHPGEIVKSPTALSSGEPVPNPSAVGAVDCSGGVRRSVLLLRSMGWSFKGKKFPRLEGALGMSYEVALKAQDCALFHGLQAHLAVDS